MIASRFAELREVPARRVRGLAAAPRGLADLGHDVLSARERFPNASDEALLALAREENRVLVTEDKDFGELVFLRGLPRPGIVRLVEMTPRERAEARNGTVLTSLNAEMRERVAARPPLQSRIQDTDNLRPIRLSRANILPDRLLHREQYDRSFESPDRCTLYFRCTLRIVLSFQSTNRLIFIFTRPMP